MVIKESLIKPCKDISYPKKNSVELMRVLNVSTFLNALSKLGILWCLGETKFLNC